MVNYFNSNFSNSKDGELHRYFYELPASVITVHTSPVDSLKIGDDGISNYYCGMISPNNKLKFRRTSCFCHECVNRNFGFDCPEIGYCGKWTDTKCSEYPSYADAVPTTSKKAKAKAKEAGKGRGKKRKTAPKTTNKKSKEKGRGEKRKRTVLSTAAVPTQTKPRKPQPGVVSVPLSSPSRKRRKINRFKHSVTMNMNMNINGRCGPPPLI